MGVSGHPPPFVPGVIADVDMPGDKADMEDIEEELAPGEESMDQGEPGAEVWVGAGGGESMSVV